MKSKEVKVEKRKNPHVIKQNDIGGEERRNLAQQLASARDMDFDKLLDYIRHSDATPTCEEMEVVCDRLKSGSNLEKVYIASFLSEIPGNEECIEPLIGMLSWDDPTDRGSACIALGNIGNRRVIPHLKRMLNDEDDMTRSDALEALRYAQDTFKLSELFKKLNDKSKFVRAVAVWILHDKYDDDKESRKRILREIKKRLSIERAGIVRADIFHMLYCVEDGSEIYLNKLLSMTAYKHHGVRARVYGILATIADERNYETILGVFQKSLKSEPLSLYRKELREKIRALKAFKNE